MPLLADITKSPRHGAQRPAPNSQPLEAAWSGLAWLLPPRGSSRAATTTAKPTPKPTRTHRGAEDADGAGQQADAPGHQDALRDAPKRHGLLLLIEVKCLLASVRR